MISGWRLQSRSHDGGGDDSGRVAAMAHLMAESGDWLSSVEARRR
jgi:hypothetical protein